MGFRYRENDRFYGRGSREDDEFYDRRGPPPSFREKRSDDRRKFMKEIAMKALFLSSKKFYLDIVEGSSGKLLKLSEVSQTGQKSKMFMDMDVAAEFHDKISDFCDFLGTINESSLSKMSDKDRGGYHSDPIKNETMVKDQKRYYLDLLENHRGMFLKLTLRSPIADRIQLLFPASGLPEVRDALTDLLSEHGSNKKRKVSEDEDRHAPRTSSTSDNVAATTVVIDDNNTDEEFRCDFNLEGVVEIRDDDDDDDVKVKPVDNKEYGPINLLDCKDRLFQFEVKNNDNGTYLSITESSTKFRSVINVPQKCWHEFVSGIEGKLNELRSRVKMEVPDNH